MAHIRTWAELQEWELTPAEEQLIEACQKGEPCVLEDGELPPKGPPDPSRHIHADVLRYLILGGCDECNVDDIGVWVEGAHITSTLDLDFTTTRGAIEMPNSRFENQIHCMQTNCRQLLLDGSDLQGISGQAMKVTGSIFLRKINPHAMIDLNSAIIGNNLYLNHASFKVNEGFAFDGQGIKVGGSVSFEGIQTRATITLVSSEISGQLVFERASFNVEEGDALVAQSANFIAGVIWRDVEIENGDLDFNTAQIGVLADDADSWPSDVRVDLDGMTYKRIAGAPTDAKMRLLWLRKGDSWRREFAPHPYTQLANVLRDMGHDSDARTILLERDRLLGPPNRARLKMIPDGTWKVGFLSLWFEITHPLRVIVDYMFRLIAGYGHRPFRSIPILLALIFITIIPAHYAWDEGSFAPNSAIIQESDGWKNHQLESNPAKSWSDKGAAGNDWETFNRYAYGLDVVIPIINFGQTEAWAPSTNRGWWGKQLYWMRWVLGALGWIVTALGAAAITGVIRRD